MSATYVKLNDAARVVADWRHGAGGVSPYTVAKRYALEHGQAIVLRADGGGVFFTRVDRDDRPHTIISRRTVKDVRPDRSGD